MSPRELAESGVMGLDDDVLQSDLTSPDSEPLRSCEVCEDASDASGLYDKSPSTCEGPVDPGRPEEHRSGILRELRRIQALEEQIMEERVKLEALRCRETESLDPEEPEPDQVRERSVFLQQLEQEKQQVEEMERSLSREMEKAKKRSSEGCRVVKCSVMERNDELRSCGLQSLPDTDEPQRTDSAFETKPEEVFSEECTSPNPADLTDSSLTSEPASTASLGRLDSESLQSCHSESVASSGLSEAGKLEESSAVPSLPASADVCPEHSEDEASSCDGADLLETQNSAEVRGAFDPGGVSIAPRSQTDGAFVCQQVERRPSDCEAQASVVPSKLMQNNNNNTAVLCSGDSPGSSVSSTETQEDCDGSMRAACAGSTLQPLQLHASSRQVQILRKHWETPVLYNTLIS